MKDFTESALTLYRALISDSRNVEERDALALITLSLRSFYEQGFQDGRQYERFGSHSFEQDSFYSE
jgi:hypothetical protein